MTVPKLRFPEFRDAGEWEGKKLEEFLTESRILGSKGDVAKKITVKLWGKGVFEKEDILKGSVSTQYYKRKAGQFIYSKLDFLNQAFGLVPNHLDGFESTVDLPCFELSEEINPIFLLEYVKRNDFYKKFGEIADGGRKAKRIQVEVFLLFPVILPPKLKEQQKIADCLSSLDDRITAETQKLDTLKAHKKGLMQQLFPAEGETLPKLRFPEFSDAGEWEEMGLKDISSYIKGFAFKSGDYESQGVRIVRVSDLGSDFIKINCEQIFISEDLAPSYDRYKLLTGDIIITTVGSKPELVDSAVGRAIYVSSKDEGLLNQSLLKLEVSDELDSRFLFLNINTSKYTRFIASISRGNANQANIAVKELLEFKIMVPSLTEQQKISDCLSSLDELITAQTQKIDTLKLHKKGLMQQLFPSVEEVKG